MGNTGRTNNCFSSPPIVNCFSGHCSLLEQTDRCGHSSVSSGKRFLLLPAAKRSFHTLLLTHLLWLLNPFPVFLPAHTLERFHNLQLLLTWFGDPYVKRSFTHLLVLNLSFSVSHVARSYSERQTSRWPLMPCMCHLQFEMNWEIGKTIKGQIKVQCFDRKNRWN